MFFFIKLRLQIFNHLSGSPRVIRGQTKSQRVGLLHMTWREIRNDMSPQSSRVLAVLSSADWLVCFAYFNPVQDSHTLPRGGSSSADKRYSLLAPSFLWTVCFRTTRLILTASLCICARMQFFRASLHDLQSNAKKKGYVNVFHIGRWMLLELMAERQALCPAVSEAVSVPSLFSSHI